MFWKYQNPNTIASCRVLLGLGFVFFWISSSGVESWLLSETDLAMCEVGFGSKVQIPDGFLRKVWALWILEVGWVMGVLKLKTLRLGWWEIEVLEMKLSGCLWSDLGRVMDDEETRFDNIILELGEKIDEKSEDEWENLSGVCGVWSMRRCGLNVEI